MKLILTEKPSVTKQMKNVLAPHAKYINCGGGNKEALGYYEDSQFVICNTVGHCVNIKNPKEINSDFSWHLHKLPYALPSELPLTISKGKENLFNVIETCFQKYDYDEIIIATDGDREGQNIWRKIDLMLGRYKTKVINRIWLDEWTPEGVQDAYDNRFPNSEKDSLAEAAQCREESDYIIGMNCTAALTNKYADGKGNIISIGRVMGPTMNIVVEREKEIRNFKSEPFTTLAIKTATDVTEDLTLKMKTQTNLSATDAKKIEDILHKEKEVTLYKNVKTTSSSCPKLYDATTIAQDMNKRYGFSAKKTSDIIQKLYQDYALTTYPGTNAKVISEGSAKKAYKILNNLTLYPELIKEIKDNKYNVSKHVVTSEGLAHEAITPVYGTINASNVDKLTSDEMKVYKAIVERFLAVFYPKAQFEEVTVTTNVASYDFEVKGKTIIEEGWMKVLGMSKDILLPKITDGYKYTLKDIIKENKKTKPPVRYTEETLLSAMKNAGKFVSDAAEAAILNSSDVEGLGTGRTRPAIIENIKQKGYFIVDKKYIYPTQKCIDLFDVLPNTTLSSPSLTAQFEQMIQDVEEGKMTRKEYMDKINADVEDIILLIKDDKSGKKIEASTGTSAAKEVKNEFGVCPICGGAITENSKAFACSNWKSGCKFTIWKNQRGKDLTKSQVKSLIEKGRTPVIKNLKTNLGTTFDAALEFDVDADGKINYSKLKIASTSKATTSKKAAVNKKDFGVCPICGKSMYEDSEKYFCSNCNTKLYKNALAKYGKKTIGKREAKKLLDGDIIEVQLIAKESKKPYTKKVYFDNTTNYVKVKW